MLGCVFTVSSFQPPILLFGQEPIFGEQAVEPADNAPADPNTDPFVQNLLEIAGRSDQQMGDSIASLARTGHWPQVNLLLERLAKRPPNATSRSAIQKRIEPSVFLQILQNDQLTDNARLMLGQLADATLQQQQSPERLRAAIGKLDDDSTDARLAAARVLVNGGNAAIIELVSAAIAAEPPADLQAILRALLRLGSGGESALRQVALYGTPEARRGAIESLALIDSRDNEIELLTALYADRSSPGELEIAGRYLSRVHGQLPSRSAAVNRLVEDLNQKHLVAQSIENTDDQSTVWSVTEQRDGVGFAKTRSIYLAYRDAADAAARLRRIGAVSPDILRQMLIADLGYRTVIDPDWGDPSQVDAIISMYGGVLDANTLLRSLSDAAASRDEAATLGLIRIIAANGNATRPDAYLDGSGGTPTALVAAALSPIPRIRYEAALTVARLADGRSYAGSSQVKRTLSEMVRLTDRPTAIIVETRPEVIAPIQRVLSTLGYNGVPVQSVAQLIQFIERGGDIRLIVSKTQLADLPPIELIDFVRRTSRGSQLPIVFYGDPSVSRVIDSDQQSTASMRWDGPIEWISQPITPSAYDGILDRIERQRRLPPLSPLDRQRLRDEAAEFISRPGTQS